MGTAQLSTSEVATLAGIHRDTLLRWLRQGLITEPARDRNGWRTFDEGAVRQVVEFARSGRSSSGPAALQQVQSLYSLDWDFHGAKTGYLTHSIHPYPAKYIPQIPNTLIQELSSVGDTVLDVFCGSGTTLVEALVLKRHAIGIDANPLAALISRAKTGQLTPEDVEAVRALADKADRVAAQVPSCETPGLFDGPPFQSSAPRPLNDKLQFWFDDFVIEELAEILSWCNAVSSPAATNLALVAFSSIVVAVSRQDSDTRYVRREKGLSSGDAFSRFARALRSALRGAREFTDVSEERFGCQVFEANVLESPSVRPVDLVVCSPPYPNAYSYHLYHMTRMLWLGMDQPSFKAAEIGSHRKFSSKSKNAATIDTFVDEMTRLFAWLSKTLRRGRHACFVVGDSKIRGTIYNNADILATAAAKSGFVEVARIERTLQTTKRAFNPNIGRTRSEHILVLCNEAEA
jgi:DNA modification methylase